MDRRSLALYTQAVLQGAFIVAKAKDNVKDAAACVNHLRRYVELLFNPRKREGTMTVRTLARTTEKPKTAEKRKQLQAVTPHLVCAGAADAIEFYTKAFGAVETMRLPGKDGRLMHAAVQIGGVSVMLVDELPDWGALSPKSLKGSPVTIHLYVEDVDAFVDRAVKAGATLKMPVADMF